MQIHQLYRLVEGVRKKVEWINANKIKYKMKVESVCGFEWRQVGEKYFYPQTLIKFSFNLKIFFTI